MRLRKNELSELSALLEQGASTPEELAEAFVKRLDELRGERAHRYAVMQVCGVPIVLGPYATDNQARKAAVGIAEKLWVVDGWTEAGWIKRQIDVEQKPEPHKVNSAEQRKREAAFWAKARPIMDGEANGLVVKDRGAVKAFKLPKGAWG